MPHGLLLAAAAASILTAWDVWQRWKFYAAMTSVVSGRVGVPMLAGFYVVVWISLTCLVFSLLGSNRRPVRWIILLVLFLWMMVQRYFAFTTHRFFEPADLARTMHLDSPTWLSLVLGLSSTRVFKVFKSAAVGTAALAIVSYRPWAPARWRVSAASLFAGLSIQTLFWTYTHLSFHLARVPVDPVSDLIRSVVYVAKEAVSFRSIPRETAHLISTAHPTENIVFILDESVRSDFLAVRGAMQPVTPYLAAKIATSPGFRDYSPAVSAATCSFESQVAILTGAQSFPDNEKRSLRNPAIWDWAKAAGFRTVLLDAQGVNFPNLVIRDTDLERLDEVVQISAVLGDAKKPETDIRVAQWLRQRLLTEKGLFIVLVKAGVHDPYEQRYPNLLPIRKWRAPTLEPHQLRSTDLTRMRNSYENSVEYAVDVFFEVLDPLSLPGLKLLYTSDHGQNLGERGEQFSHCGRGLEQAIVPLFTLTTDSPAEPSPAAVVHSHHQIYPTLRSWFAGKDVSWGDYRSLSAAEQSRLSYMTGSIWAGSEIIPVDPSEALRFGQGPGRNQAPAR